ncbi:MAG: flagellar hook assembly protein FlgD [Gammaproteobacteria bacterium]
MAFDVTAVQDLGLKTVGRIAAKKQSLGQEQFLKLLTTQMTHQDPTKPMENGDFLGQMAQFGTVSGIQDLQQSFSEFASAVSSGQALQAASLVGRSVLVPGDEGLLSLTDGLSGQIDLTGPTDDLKIEFFNRNGEVVKELHLGPQSAGMTPFSWDGQLTDGTFADPGAYTIKASAAIDGNNTALQTFVKAGVSGVKMAAGNQGIRLSLNGLDDIAFNQVRQIL